MSKIENMDLENHLSDLQNRVKVQFLKEGDRIYSFLGGRANLHFQTPPAKLNTTHFVRHQTVWFRDDVRFGLIWKPDCTGYARSLGQAWSL